MHSNNDGMPDDWKPTPNDPFENFMNDKKISYMQNNSGTFNTVHVTEWAHDYVRKLERDLAAEKSRSQKLVEAIKKELKAMGNCCCGAEEQSGEGYTDVVCYLHEALSAYSTDYGDGGGNG